MFGGGMMKRVAILNYVGQSDGKVAISELVQELDTKEKDVKKAVEWARKKLGMAIHIEDDFVVMKASALAQLKSQRQQQQPTVVREVVYMIKCDNCQHDNLQGTQKCTNCGAPL
jgi:rRNA maturation endonuclease Nob1